jgi:hypothetical protein
VRLSSKVKAKCRIVMKTSMSLKGEPGLPGSY